MVLAHQSHCTCLGPSFPHLFHETHLTTNLQFVEGIVKHAVTVEIDNPFVRGLDPAEILIIYKGRVILKVAKMDWP